MGTGYCHENLMKTYSITSLPLGGQLVTEWYPIQVGDVSLQYSLALWKSE